MQRLSGTDSLFLAGETPAWHQHVGGLSIIDPSGVAGFAYEAVVRSIGERLPLIPKLTWKLREVPLGLHRAVWVSDANFDVRRHVRRIGVPRPGGPRETAEVVGQILGTQLNRRYPLWEIWYLEGLVNGRVGFLMKYHHCLLDGVAGSGMAALLFDFEASPPTRQIPPMPAPEPEPSDACLLLQSLVPSATAPWRVARYGARLARRGIDALGYARSQRPKPDVSAMMQAPRTSFNHSIGGRRAMSFTSVALDDVKALRRHYDVKVNDVVLALCSGALRIYLDERGELPVRTLTAGVPVSTRVAGDASLDNQVSYMVVPLATDIGDPTERLRAIHTHTVAAKEMTAAMRVHPIGSIGQTAPPWVLAAAMRLAYESHLLSYVPGMMNTIVSNVPGPAVPLYLAGARLTGIFSASVILEGMGVNMTIFSFGDRVDFGIHVDPDLVPDPWDVAAAVSDALTELMTAAHLGPPTPVEDAFGLKPL
jgi:diacylglycerol O-acyltransferase / wax synthase